MTFAELFQASGVVPASLSVDVPVGVLNSDTRQLLPGEVFVAMPSENTDTHALFAQAFEKGACAVIAHSEVGYLQARQLGPAAWLPPADFPEAMWRLARTAYGDPGASMQVIGVTGTNGKTTVAWLVREALAALGVRSAYLGTLGLRMEGVDRFLGNTTPFAIETYRLLAECRDARVQTLALEVSSHALDQKRADGIGYDVGIFTNLTQDHLDYHPSMADYAAAKWRLFSDLVQQSAKRFTAAFNVDDPTGKVWADRFIGDRIGFGVASGELRGSPAEVGYDRLHMRLIWQGQEAEVRAGLGGAFNVANVTAAAAGLVAIGLPLEEAAAGLSRVPPVPGRFEPVPNSRGFGVIVDFAHTPDALRNLLDSARLLKPRRLIVVFGCGGDRDPTKRPLMARTVSERADLTIVTSDNPRTEDPEAIIAMVVEGISPGAEYHTIPDRREAVETAIRLAAPGDLVVLAGKGHETYQIIGRTKHPMDDRELARTALESLP